MTDISEEIEITANCKTCMWNQFCIKPPTMTRDEVEKNFEKLRRDIEKDLPREDAGIAMLMGIMMISGKDRNCPVCPGFARRMKEPILSQKIKELMQNGKEALPKCKTCGWEKFCLEPPMMTEKEQKSKIEEFAKGDDPMASFTGHLMGEMFYGNRATECSACPVFIQEIRQSPNLAQQIKKIMQNWES